MHACSVSPPPPGALAADSLALALEAVEEAVIVDDAVVVTVLAEPPLESMI